MQDVEVRGQEALFATRQRGDRLIFLPNHPTHSDPQIMLDAMRQIGIATEFMAAYDLFLRSRLRAFAMSHCGAFSVDREGLDAQALKHAHNTLLQGRHALTVFPEGNVFLQNDILAPFNEGPAFLALKAAKELASQQCRVLAVPVAIKATYVEDVTPRVFEQVWRLGESVEAPLDRNADPLCWLRMVGHQALRRNQRTRGLAESSGGEPRTIIQRAVDDVLTRLEQKVGLPPLPCTSLLERVCRVRRAIHAVRIDESRKVDHSAAAVWADEAMLAFKVASYLGDYVHRRPTLDRYAETVQKLDEDIHSHVPAALGPRHAWVQFGEPLDVSEYLGSSARLRQAAAQLTSACQQAVQQGLDKLNESNPHPGGGLVAQPHESQVLIEAI